MKRLLVVTAFFAVKGLQAQRNSDVVDYVNTYKEIAIREEQRSGVPAAITLAQGIHESMAGKSELVLKSNNHFGIKCQATWKGEKVYHDDDARGECFRSYEKPEQSYIDHSDFLKNGSRYAFLFQLDPTKYNDWAYGLKKAGYATNPKYPQILIKYIEDYNLQQYTLIALGKLSPKDEVLAGNGRPVNIGTGVVIQQIPSGPKPVVDYPIGEFKINRTKVIFAKAGTSLLGIAKQFDVSLKHLLDFNEFSEDEDDVLAEDQLVFVQRKRREGPQEFHEVRPGETLYDISQSEGIRLEYLINYNRLQDQGEPAVGEKLYLQGKAPEMPKLAKDVVLVTPAPPVVIPTPTQITPTNSSAVSGTIHIVAEKETLFSIAKKYSITVEQLKEWNKLTGNDLKIGQELVIYKN
ncbi:MULTISPECIES: glucosaminidase domain-containing protein [Niastella]|uniref:Peptidoglycan hydrolase n=1 Tax=Niastella soli TaxID=2821487 RepID=A0ABS3YM62_9BACT|nr:glucosaminidase domain-containing protein [Niastella soli]MBO9198962.1 LysM peptidoglycan-binding domain-containing protein [Niastella soli]